MRSSAESKTEPIVCPFTVLIDSREKAPYRFAGLRADARQNKRPIVVPTKFARLKTGDYTIKGMEDLVAIERKSLTDLYTTLGQHRERFEREHERLARLACAAVVIEASWNAILTGRPPRCRLLPKVVFRTAISWQQKYGVPWVAYDSRRLAEVATFRFLEKFFHHHKSKGEEHGRSHRRQRSRQGARAAAGR